MTAQPLQPKSWHEVDLGELIERYVGSGVKKDRSQSIDRRAELIERKTFRIAIVID